MSDGSKGRVAASWLRGPSKQEHSGQFGPQEYSLGCRKEKRASVSQA